MGVGVRNAGKRLHAGWDLYATPGTQALAITDGTVLQTGVVTGYGNILVLGFEFQGRPHYALYAHLLRALVNVGQHGPTQVKEGDPLALTGVSGNAIGEPPHLHFEVWTKRHVGRYPDGRISPGEVLGFIYDNMDNRLPAQNIG
jgi:murein DD-endopeptidase MepM/ murein hydrolase activator NlpD